MVYSINFKNKATNLRKKGFSLDEISKRINISKGTASLWLRNIELNKKAKTRIVKRGLMGQRKAIKKLKEKRIINLKKTEEKIVKSLLKINFHKDLKKLLCSILFWGEGEKGALNRLAFINSDPKMIATFLKLLRSGYNLDEKKFRALVHVHGYHNEKEIKEFWSKITRIPLSQFNRSYLKPNTGKNFRKEFKGTISIRYYDSKIAHELNIIYNMFTKSLGV